MPPARSGRFGYFRRSLRLLPGAPRRHGLLPNQARAARPAPAPPLSPPARPPARKVPLPQSLFPKNVGYFRTGEESGTVASAASENTRRGFKSPQIVNSSEISSSTFGCFRRFSPSSEPSHPLPAKGSASSDNSNRPSLAASAGAFRFYPRTLSEKPTTSNNPNRPSLRHFTQVSSARQRLCSILNFGSFPRFRLLTPPHWHNFGSFRQRFGKPHSRRQLRLFPSVLRLLPASGPKREGGRRRGGSGEGIRGRGGVPAPDLALREGRVEEKKSGSRGSPKKAARDKSSQQGEGCARPLRRLAALL